MAIYIRAEKECETDSYVIYRYGIHYDNLDEKLKLYKGDFLVKRITGQGEIKHDYTSLVISSKIYKYFNDNGVFPEAISKES